MKHVLKTKVISFMIACTLMFSMLTICKTSAYASDYKNLIHKVGNSIANTPINYNFSLTRTSNLQFVVKTNERTGVTIIVKEAQYDTPTATITMAVTNPNWSYQAQSGIYLNKENVKLDAGDYILEFRTDTDVNYDLAMNQKSATPKLNKKSFTITKGFTDTITVKNGKIKSCSSSNASVATVNNKGKLVAISNGKSTIKVKLTNNKTLTCKINVVSNQYTAKKISVDDSIYNVENMKVYQASFDKKGNLKIKFKIVNNSTGKIERIKNLKIVAKNKKTYASYTVSNYNVAVDSFTDKSYTITIPKSKVKMDIKKIDLRTSKISITGKMVSDTL